MPGHSQSQLQGTPMKTIVVIFSAAVMLQGCAMFGWDSVSPIEIRKKAQERTQLNISDPKPLQPATPQWYVVTPENQAQVFADLKKKNIDQVLFALTDDGYEELAINTAEQRNFIAQLREILNKYKEYYEPGKKDEQPSR